MEDSGNLNEPQKLWKKSRFIWVSGNAAEYPSYVLLGKGLLYSQECFDIIYVDVDCNYRTPYLRKYTLCIYLDYLVVSMVYYGLSLSGATISDDPFLYMVLSGLMEVPAYTLTAYIVDLCGRKGTLCGAYLLTAVVLLAIAVTPAG